MMIDARMRHSTLPFLEQPLFDSLRRWWGGLKFTEEIPVAFTLAATDRGGVRI